LGVEPWTFFLRRHAIRPRSHRQVCSLVHIVGGRDFNQSHPDYHEIKTHLCCAQPCADVRLYHARNHQRHRPARNRTYLSSSAIISGRPHVSAYSMGMMGYRTPNIDRIAKEGMMFTDYYAEQSCTAGVRRSSPINAHCAPACPRSACRVVSALQSTTTATSGTLPMWITHHVGKRG